MAAEYKSVFVFLDENDKQITYSYPYANPVVGADDMNTAMNAFIANGSVLKRVPVKKKSAYLIETTKTDFAIE